MAATQSGVIPRHDLSDQIADARRRTDELFAVVRPEFLYERPIAERHRIIFYIGHLEAFDWNLLGERVFRLKSLQPEFDRLFAFGIDPVGGGLPTDQPSDWPSMAQVRDYVGGVRRVLDDAIEKALASSMKREFDGFPLTTFLNVAIEHRLMHAETLAYMFHQLPLDKKIPQPDSLDSKTSPLVQSSIAIPEGTVALGLARSSGSFGWDNEFEFHTVEVPPFAIDRYKVTNEKYLEFVNDGGYDARDLWVHENSFPKTRSARSNSQITDIQVRDEDWRWRSEQGISYPAFWKRQGDTWLYRTMFQEILLPLDWPVYVSHAEAKAFAKWAGKSLPSEAEWQRAAYGTPLGKERNFPWGDDAPSSRFGNFDFDRWSPAPVNAFPAGQSAFGVDGMLGNGWEWTSTEFAPFAGFEPFSFYPGYSANFFDGKHFVMKGGSARTAACMLRRTFRNWFQSHYQYMYAGFRCVSR